MKYCPNCGTGLDDTAAFCVSCGTPQGQPVQPAEAPEVVPTTAYVGEPQSPAYAPAPHYNPVYPASYAPAPTSNVGAKVSAGIGFGLVMFGLMWAFLVFLMGISAGVDYDEELAGSVLCLFFLFAPPSLVGLILCSNGRKNGAGALAVVGKVFGIISIVMYGLGALVSLIAFT